MFDSEGAWFLIVIFILWVLESVAKARQRSRHPEGAEEGNTLSVPTTLEAPPQDRAPRERQPRNLWEEIAEIARQKQEQEQQRQPQRLPTADLPRREAPPRRRRPERMQPPVLPERTPSSRWEGAAEEGKRRPDPVEAAAADERRSDRWLAGRAQEGESSEGAATYDSEAARTPTFDVTAPRRAELTARDASRAPAPHAQAVGVSRRAGRARRVPVPVPAAGVAGSAGHPLGADAHSLRGASRAELRRILILKEVLGPPVALRDVLPPDE